MVGAGRVSRSVRVLEALRPAVVLGSAEPLDHLDPDAVAASGLEVVRRRSGGSAVVVGPGRSLWVDVAIPRGDPLWHDDIGRASWWVGELWAAALEVVGVGPAVVWRGGLVRAEWSDRACFAGLGPGEVTVEGRKVVGVSQRRTRAGALFQCAGLVAPDARGQGPDALAELGAVQSLSTSARSALVVELRGSTFPLLPEQASGLISALKGLLPGA
jgi:lipoate-protein ligase A